MEWSLEIRSSEPQARILFPNEQLLYVYALLVGCGMPIVNLLSREAQERKQEGVKDWGRGGEGGERRRAGEQSQGWYRLLGAKCANVTTPAGHPTRCSWPSGPNPVFIPAAASILLNFIILGPFADGP